MNKKNMLIIAGGTAAGLLVGTGGGALTTWLSTGVSLLWGVGAGALVGVSFVGCCACAAVLVRRKCKKKNMSLSNVITLEAAVHSNRTNLDTYVQLVRERQSRLDVAEKKCDEFKQTSIENRVQLERSIAEQAAIAAENKDVQERLDVSHIPEATQKMREELTISAARSAGLWNSLRASTAQLEEEKKRDSERSARIAELLLGRSLATMGPQAV